MNTVPLPPRLTPQVATKLARVAHAFQRDVPATMKPLVLTLAGYRMLDQLAGYDEPVKRTAAQALAFVGCIALRSKLSVQDIGRGAAELVEFGAQHRMVVETLAKGANPRAEEALSAIERSIRRAIGALRLRAAAAEFRRDAPSALVAFNEAERLPIPAPRDLSPVAELTSFQVCGASAAPAMVFNLRRYSRRTQNLIQ